MEIRNCWEFQKCSELKRRECMIYHNNLGNECWLFQNGSKNPSKISEKPCWKCPWFLKNYPECNIT